MFHVSVVRLSTANVRTWYRACLIQYLCILFLAESMLDPLYTAKDMVIPLTEGFSQLIIETKTGDYILNVNKICL